MRDLFTIALIAVCLAFPVKTEATTNFAHVQQSVPNNLVTDSETVNKVIDYLALNYQYNSAVLHDKFKVQELVIHATRDGYDVCITDNQGGVIISIIENL